MRTGWTHAQTRTILRIWAVPCMARGVRRRSLPPSKRGRRRIVLSGPSVLPRLSVSGPRNRRQPARQNRNRDARPPWISSPPPPDSWRSLRRATYPPLRRAPPPPANHAATASRCPMSLKSPYKRGFSSPPTPCLSLPGKPYRSAPPHGQFRTAGRRLEEHAPTNVHSDTISPPPARRPPAGGRHRSSAGRRPHLHIDDLTLAMPYASASRKSALQPRPRAPRWWAPRTSV